MLTFDDTAPTEPAIDPLAAGAGEESATQSGDVSRWKQPTGAAWITAVIGALAAALYLWNLDGVGNANSYYTAPSRTQVEGQFRRSSRRIALAVTPIATAMFRNNNPDAFLTFLGVSAAWAMWRALEVGVPDSC